MKQTYIFCLLFLSIFSTAQIITIPDANFKGRLLAASPTDYIAQDLTGNWVKIDTNSDSQIQLSEALQIKSLSINNSLIYSLVGIEYFTNLEFLNCNYNGLTSLNLNNLLNLKFLFCANNFLGSININLLTNLQQLKCSSNQIINLNQNLVLLTNLTVLECRSNQLTSLNVDSLSNLLSLNCNSNQINSLNLNTLINLNSLSCSGNQLNTLDLSTLSNLNFLDCSINYLTTLDVSAQPLLTSLGCNGNYLTTLDVSLQPVLTSLYCGSSNLISLFIKNGSIESLSILNSPNLRYICADENQLASVQSTIMSSLLLNCHTNSYCSFTPGGTFYTINGGNKFDDENNGCDASDSFFSKIKYSITSGTITGSIISNNSGLYSIPVQSGTHTISPVLENLSYFTVSPTNTVVSFPSQTSPFIQDFCFTANGTHHDVEISILPLNPARPGFEANYKIIFKNKGNQTENGTINLQFNDAILDVVSTNPAFTTQTTNNLSFNYSNLNPFETREISLVFNLNSPTETPAVNSGDILNYTATNTISNTDEILSDNTFVLNQTVVNSYDPNDKRCLQGNTIAPSEVGKYVHYMIRFENTGTFPAQNIVVRDMINTTKFDVSSLIPLYASHNYFTRISGNKVEFVFENINLPIDNANNDGYVAFKIKTLPSLVIGNTFSNWVSIYFDYNFPIVTNTATTTIAVLSNPSFEFADYFSLYPNPTKNELNINLKSTIEINSIQIYNTIGQLVTVQTGNALKVDVSNLKTGNYFIKINTNEGFSTSQFIKE